MVLAWVSERLAVAMRQAEDRDYVLDKSSLIDLELLTNKGRTTRGKMMKEELIKYVMEKADQCYSDDFPINNIECWIRDFFDQHQPERSKREDLLKPVENSMGYKFSKEVSFTVTPPRCGALNTMET